MLTCVNLAIHDRDKSEVHDFVKELKLWEYKYKGEKMRLLRNISVSEEFITKDKTIAVARRLFDTGEYSKEWIGDICNLTEQGYEEVIKRATIMKCAKIFFEEQTIEFVKEKLMLNEEEVKDLIRHRKE